MAESYSTRPTKTSSSVLTAERLRAVLHYDPETGSFTRVGGGVVNVRPTSYGYIRIRVDGSARHAQRLAVLYMTGAWPEKGVEVDHINGVRTDNKWSNLRLVSVSVNQQNRRAARSDSSVGLLGVSRHKNKFRAQIWLNQKKTNLGYFNTAEQAHQAYLTAKRAMHVGSTL